MSYLYKTARILFLVTLILLVPLLHFLKQSNKPFEVYRISYTRTIHEVSGNKSLDTLFFSRKHSQEVSYMLPGSRLIMNDSNNDSKYYILLFLHDYSVFFPEFTDEPESYTFLELNHPTMIIDVKSSRVIPIHNNTHVINVVSKLINDSNRWLLSYYIITTIQILSATTIACFLIYLFLPRKWLFLSSRSAKGA
jgi:hypothetical protein